MSSISELSLDLSSTPEFSDLHPLLIPKMRHKRTRIARLDARSLPHASDRLHGSLDGDRTFEVRRIGLSSADEFHQAFGLFLTYYCVELMC